MIYWGEHHSISNRIRNNRTAGRHSHSIQEYRLRATLCANRQLTWGLVRVPPNRITSIRYRHVFVASRANLRLRDLAWPIPGNSQKQICLVEQRHINRAPNARWTSIVIFNMRILRLIVNVAGEHQGLLPPIRLILTRQWQKLMYARNGKTIQGICVMVIGKMMESSHTRNSGHKNAP